MHCKNCHTELHPNADFCYNCGAKVIRNRLTLKNLMIHLGETFFNYDNKLLRTFIDLFKKPEAVIGSYVDGVRMRYVNPLNFFGVSLTLSGLSTLIIQKFYLEYLDYSQIFNLEMYSNEAAQFLENSANIALEFGSLILSAMIPFMAIISIIVFYNKRYNFTEHLIIYLYSMSAITILSVFVGQMLLFSVPEYYVNYIYYVYLFMFFYYVYSLQRVFELNIKQLILKTLLFLILFFIFYLGFSIIAAIYMLSTGIINLQDFAPPS